MRVALCQLNTKVGDIRGNRTRMISWYKDATAGGADLVVFPELALTGYPPLDLIELEDFIAAFEEAIPVLAAETNAAGLLFGTPIRNPGPAGKRFQNGAVLCAGGRVVAQVGKKLLPVYDVFDEARQFEASPEPGTPVSFRGLRLGLHVCEDAWNEEGFWPRRLYGRDPVSELAGNGAQILLNISASPFHRNKIPLRRSLLRSHCQRHRLPLLYTNAVGGNDDLVFDGEAYVFDHEGTLRASGNPFHEEILMVEVTEGTPCGVNPLVAWRPDDGRDLEPAVVRSELDELEAVHRALVLGLRDYAAKCGFTTAVLGLSGGIDSALTAALAAEALGPQNVFAVALPSRYSSPGSLADAQSLAANLGIRYEVISIEPTFKSLLGTLEPLFAGTRPGEAEENLQARSRGMILMALSNKFGHLLLTTGNKSELAVGYCTLYGDMAGGLAVISDVPKTLVYGLSRHLNRERTIIPESTLTKPPSAELKPDQTDQDSLPPYEVLDAILEGFVEEGKGVSDLVAAGLDRSTVVRIIDLVTRAEYKRRQAAPGIKISPKAFGTGRRMPIASGWPPRR
jgi:NAD+ synthase (glutamine-hydrolysing)